MMQHRDTVGSTLALLGGKFYNIITAISGCSFDPSIPVVIEAQPSPV